MPTASDYNRVMRKAWDGVPGPVRRNVWPNHAVSFVKAAWKAETGRVFHWKIRIGSGNRDTWLHGRVFTVNPDRGWHSLNHAMSHFIERRTTGDAHSDHHLEIERNGALLIRRRFLETEPPPTKVKPTVDLVAKRAASIERRIPLWEAKERKAKKALKKLRRQQKYYAKKVA